MNGVATQGNRLLHVIDSKTGWKWLVDGGAMVSILPASAEVKKRGATDAPLQAANGSIIETYGKTELVISIANRTFQHEFIIADVRSRILGADFLAENYLAPNHRDCSLIDLATFETLPAAFSNAFSSPINFVNQANDKFYKLLDSFPSITTPAFTIRQPKHGVKHHIPTTCAPLQSRVRKLAPDRLQIAKAEIDKLCDLGVCHRGKSEWASPLMVAPKPGGGWRVCGDYRRLNNATPDDKYPVRTLTDFTADLAGKKVFSKVDLLKGYHQIPVADEDVCKTGVITPFGLFIFKRTPFGLKNAGQDFQRLMDEILGDIPRVFVYIDDILIASDNEVQHLEDLRTVFKTLQTHGMVVNRAKCVLGQPNLEFLGYTVNAAGITPLPERVEAIRAVPPPTTVKELQSFLGMINYYRRFIPNAAQHLFPLFDQLKGKPKTIQWTPDCQTSFQAVKSALASTTLLHHPRTGANLALTTDASNYAIGAVLEQRGPDGWEPLAFYSAKLQDNQRKWPPYDRELLAIFRATRHFRPMLEGRPFTVYTDHQSLVPSIAKKTDPLTARQTYQLSCIAEYTTDIRYIEGKSNVVADALSRPPQTTLEDLGIASIQNTDPPQGVSSPGHPRSVSVPPQVVSLSSASSKEEDLGRVINAIGPLRLDLVAMARDQPLDRDFVRLSNEARTGLRFRRVVLGGAELIVDVSNGPARPYVPFNWRRRVFRVIHELGHPGVERTRQTIADKFVWPSLREDCTRWARECVPCQQAKIHRHTVPPIGEFIVPERRFTHLNMDLVGPLPMSNGCKWLLTIVDRFTRWPVAIPLPDTPTEEIIDNFALHWVANYGVPASITTDRDSRFTSNLWTQMMQMWGIKSHYTTAYHPAANGLVERFHRRLKECLHALAEDGPPEEWFWRLPNAMLAIRTTIKPDINACPAELVYGEGLCVPGTALPTFRSHNAELQNERLNTLDHLRLEVARLLPTPTSAHRQPRVNIPEHLADATHVFVRRAARSGFHSPYLGPFRVTERNDTHFKIVLPGRGTDSVALERLKPAILADDDPDDDARSEQSSDPSAPSSPSNRQPTPAPPFDLPDLEDLEELEDLEQLVQDVPAAPPRQQPPASPTVSRSTSQSESGRSSSQSGSESVPSSQSGYESEPPSRESTPPSIDDLPLDDLPSAQRPQHMLEPTSQASTPPSIDDLPLHDLPSARRPQHVLARERLAHVESESSQGSSIGDLPIDEIPAAAVPRHRRINSVAAHSGGTSELCIKRVAVEPAPPVVDELPPREQAPLVVDERLPRVHAPTVMGQQNQVVAPSTPSSRTRNRRVTFADEAPKPRRSYANVLRTMLTDLNKP